jgi:nitrite reductase (NADH) large subunit
LTFAGVHDPQSSFSSLIPRPVESCVDSGYEIGVGGAAGMDVKEVERLAKVATEEEALEVVAAFVQLYRESARYLHRPYKWIARVGLDWVKARVVEDLASRRALHDRFMLSQTVYRKDPWAERVQGAEAQEFAPLADFATLRAAE